MSWLFAGGQASVSDRVFRSQSGRIVANTLTDGGTGYPSRYRFDRAGRLIEAVIPGHTLTYAFPTGGCGVNPEAGLNGNRTTFTDLPDGGTPVTTAYCYDRTDRLTSTTVTGAAAGPTCPRSLPRSPPPGSHTTPTGTPPGWRIRPSGMTCLTSTCGPPWPTAP